METITTTTQMETTTDLRFDVGECMDMEISVDHIRSNMKGKHEHCAAKLTSDEVKKQGEEKFYGGMTGSVTAGSLIKIIKSMMTFQLRDFALNKRSIVCWVHILS